MPDDLRYYILFANYEQGLRLHDILDEAGIKNRIAPAPHGIQGELSCGMSLLIEAMDIDCVRQNIAQSGADYHSIVPFRGQLRAGRDKYC